MSDETIILLFWIGFTIIIMFPLFYWSIKDLYANRYIQHFRRSHPDWTEAREAVIQSGKLGGKLEHQRQELKKNIDSLIMERGYIPFDMSYEMTSQIELLKQEYWETIDQITKHNAEHEKLQLLYQELTDKYKPKHI